MKIVLASCLGETVLGQRCRKKPLVGLKFCRSHADASGSGLRPDLRRRRLAEKEQAAADHWESFPEHCPRCKQWEECHCAEYLEVCARCMMRQCECKCLQCHRWVEACQCVSQITKRETPSLEDLMAEWSQWLESTAPEVPPR